ncbi:dermonecrotic toxin domain-containing protein [Pseudomonas soli]|uniref:RING-type E3 ubiquitin transferase n=1 Tax=Pseudomonas soli TaxID=1306993 RepID=A0A2V4I4B9_9PSED|nr:DUF6543 domain-containing protein [Pseudomonas soli]PYB81392.1 hypothetical protein DMX07_14850 [Pseudomonas soli]
MTSPLPPLSAFIDARLPTWLRQAGQGRRATLESRIRASHSTSRQVREHLDMIATPQSFAEQKLEPSLREWYPNQSLPTSSQGWLWNIDSRRDMSWLEAALLNFAKGSRVRLATARHGDNLSLDNQRFVDGVRALDIGGQYQRLLRTSVDNARFRTMLALQDRNALAADLVIADLRGLLDPSQLALGEALVGKRDFTTSASGQRCALQCCSLRIFDTVIHGPLLMRRTPRGREESCFLYLPGDDTPLTGYPTFQHAAQALTRRLRNDRFRRHFARYIADFDKPHFFRRLRETLFPRYPYLGLRTPMPELTKGDRVSWLSQWFPPFGAIWQETLDHNARLPMAFVPWDGDCFEARARLAVQRLLADARTQAVPTAQRDAEQLAQQLEHWLSIGMTVLNLASLPLEVLQLPMLMVGGAQLVGTFLDGIHAANEGDADAAIHHLFDVIGNLAQFAVLGFAARGLAEPPGVLHDWLPAHGESGTRLWSGNLMPFSREAPWPVDTPLHATGLPRWNDKHWLILENRAFELEQGTADRWQLQPARGVRHKPVLRGSNGQGAWLLGHERPASWDTWQLLRRLGPPTRGLDDTLALRALQASSYDANALRKVIVEREPAPALLLDSLQALGADPVPLPVPGAGDETLARDFPSLSPRVRAQVLDEATREDLHMLREHRRVPLAIAESARLYQREARINRALQGFYQGQAGHADRDEVAFAVLSHMSGRDTSLRIELRQDTPEGKLLLAVGAPHLPAITLTRDALGYRYWQTGAMPADRVDLFHALFEALPEPQRRALELPEQTAQGLRDALFLRAHTQRDQVAAALRMPPLRKLFRLPGRLADGRLGYALSGRGQGWLTEDELFDQLYPEDPLNNREQLRLRLREEAGSRPGAFERLLEAQRADFNTLDIGLQRWIDLTAPDPADTFHVRRNARSSAALSIRRAWRRQGTPDSESTLNHVVLQLDAEHLAELPRMETRLSHVRHLALSNLQDLYNANIDPFLRAFPNLRYLDLTQCRLNELPEALGELTQLRSLDLSGNRLDIDSEASLGLLTRLPRLERLLLTGAVENISAESLQRLSSLQHLWLLVADENYLAWEAEHFQALQQWPALTHLSLSLNDITLTEQSRAALNGLNRLQTMYLSDNPLDMAPDLTGWQRLQRLDLEDSALSQWPIGIEQLLNQRPLQLRELDLSSNLLEDAPHLRDSAFAQALRAGEDVSYNLNGNPFSERALLRLVDAGLTPVTGSSEAQLWRSDWPEDLQLHVTNTAQAPQWRPLYALFERLPQTPDFQRSPTTMSRRMQDILITLADLEPATHDVPGWGRAELQQQINDLLRDAGQECVDQAELLFQQVETQVNVWRTVARAPANASDTQVAIDTATALLRQQRLDERIGALFNARATRRRVLAQAPDQAAPALDPDDDLPDEQLTAPNYPLDEVEMALHARMQLQTRLNLPSQPQVIRFDYLARLSGPTLQRLAADVEQYSNLARLAEWATDQAFWQGWMRRLHPARFTALVNEWAGASEYFDTLSEAGPVDTVYTGPTVPQAFIDVLVRDYPAIQWQRDGWLLRVDLVSGRYVDEGTLYLGISSVLLSTRQQAETSLMGSLTRETLGLRPA